MTPQGPPGAPDDDLRSAHVAPRLHTGRFGRPYHFLPTCASTNDEVAAHARRDAAEGLVVTADQQTGGRGRLGRTWHSPAGENLYLSLLLRPACAPSALPPLTLLAGAVAAKILTDWNLRPTLKWPNDILLPTKDGPRKVAGILTEMASDQHRIRHVVLGMGINVNSLGFPSDISARATSLRLFAGRPLDRAALLLAFLQAFETSYDRLMVEGPAYAIETWRNYAALGGRCRVEREGKMLEGLALDVDDDGALKVLDDRGQIHRVVSGEIT